MHFTPLFLACLATTISASRTPSKEASETSQFDVEGGPTVMLNSEAEQMPVFNMRAGQLAGLDTVEEDSTFDLVTSSPSNPRVERIRANSRSITRKKKSSPSPRPASVGLIVDEIDLEALTILESNEQLKSSNDRLKRRMRHSGFGNKDVA